MREIIKLAGILFIISSVAAVLLGLTNMATQDVIAHQLELENTEARQSALPIANEFEMLENSEAADAISNDDNRITEIYTGKQDGEIVGYAFKVTPKGYGGEIVLNVGISLDGKVTGIKIVNHGETPGLGAKAAEDDFQNQFIDQSADSSLTVVKGGSAGDGEVQAIAGATITATAVTEGVNQAIELYNQILK